MELVVIALPSTTMECYILGLQALLLASESADSKQQ